MPTKEQIIKDLAEVINRHSMEQQFGANVPDFILGEIAYNAIKSFLENFKKGCDWYNVHLEPTNSHFKATTNNPIGKEGGSE